jgi:hypothetical protein
MIYITCTRAPVEACSLQMYNKGERRPWPQDAVWALASHIDTESQGTVNFSHLPRASNWLLLSKGQPELDFCVGWPDVEEKIIWPRWSDEKLYMHVGGQSHRILRTESGDLILVHPDIGWLELINRIED